MSTSEIWDQIWNNLYLILAGVTAGAAGYFGNHKRVPSSSATKPEVLAIGAEISNRQQLDEQNQLLRRIAIALEAIADRKQYEMSDKLDELLERLDRKS